MTTPDSHLRSDNDPERLGGSRRTFLQLAVLSASGVLFAGGGREVQALTDDEITEQVIANAEKLSGLTFTDKERAMMVGPLRRSRDHFDRIRGLHLPNDIPPAIFFQVAADPPPKLSTSKPGLEPDSSEKTVRPESDEELAFLPASTLGRLVRSGAVSPVELTELYLERLRRVGPKLKCVISLREAEALQEARQAEREIRDGRYRGALHGLPWGAKDLLATRDTPTTWGAAPYRTQQLEVDAAVVERLREAGAILVAKLSLGALAQGDVWFGGRTLNPWNTKRGSSGSSAGPAAATAAGLVAFSVGSETLGSIVMPSTVCGVSGLRPTFGRISRYGAMSLSHSMDKLGPMCRTAEDCGLVFGAIEGRDRRDPASRDAPFGWPLDRQTVSGLRVGYLKGEFEAVRNRDDAALNERVLETLGDLGVKLEARTLPDFPVSALRMILMVEAAAMFDELTRSDRDDELKQQHPLAWPNSFRTARMIPAVEYLKAQQARTLLQHKMEETMEDLDVLLTPSTTGPALTFTNLTGHPAVVVPSGFIKGAPRSITFLGSLYGDDRALALAHAYQGATKWHTQHPLLA